MVIESVLADDKPMGLADETNAKPVRIPAGTLRLQINFAALSYTEPGKNKFRYRLEGFDPDWIYAGTGQTALFTQPPPGTYRFHVWACNNDWVWNETGAALELAVLPLFWQTSWFQALVVATGAGLVYWLFRWRLAEAEGRRLVQEAFSRQIIETQEAERQRIAQELHDSIGQSLLLAKNYLAQGMTKVAPTSAVAEDFEPASTEVTRALEEVRATARALHPLELECLGLGLALEAMLARIAGATPIRILSDLDDLGNWHGGEAQIQLYRIAQEAVNNVVKHSKAGKVILELKRETEGIRLTVQDDGVGFDPGHSGRENAFGLPGMQERARLLGGEFSVKSAVGKGCRVTVVVPMPEKRHE